MNLPGALKRTALQSARKQHSNNERCLAFRVPLEGIVRAARFLAVPTAKRLQMRRKNKYIQIHIHIHMHMNMHIHIHIHIHIEVVLRVVSSWF